MLLTVICIAVGFGIAAANGKDKFDGALIGFAVGAVITVVAVTANPRNQHCIQKAHGFQNLVSLPMKCS